MPETRTGRHLLLTGDEMGMVKMWDLEKQLAREVVAVNAVRGARPIVRLDGAPVGVLELLSLERLACF